MKCISALWMLCAAGVAWGQHWHHDLDAACDEAREQKKFVLLRQVVCECNDVPCAYAEFATSPWFLRNDGIRSRIEKRFVCVAVHVRPRTDLCLKDPGFPEAVSPVRTIFLTCRKYVMHRLDLCGHSGAMGAELDFVLKDLARCFVSDGTPRLERQQDLEEAHFKHRTSPYADHRGGGIPAPECCCPPPEDANRASENPWPEYQRGIVWHTDVGEAKSLAARDGRLVFYFQIAGDMSKEGC